MLRMGIGKDVGSISHMDLTTHFPIVRHMEDVTFCALADL